MQKKQLQLMLHEHLLTEEHLVLFQRTLFHLFGMTALLYHQMILPMEHLLQELGILNEHNLIKHVPHIEEGDIFDNSDDEIIRVEHDMVDEDYEEPLQVAHKVSAGSSFKRPMVADIEEGFILGRDKTFDVMMDQINNETASSLTNMHVLDHVNSNVV